MVADFKFKDVPRSLVRVPGSGRSQGVPAPAISCDLGRVSSLAATIPVNPCLPAIMMGTKLVVASATSHLAKNKLAINPAMSGIQGIRANPSQRRPMTPKVEAEMSRESKRPRLGVHFTSTNISSSQPVGASAGSQSNVGQENPNPTVARKIVIARRTRPRAAPSTHSCSRSIEDLLEEQRNLREENRLLQQQLARYTQMRLERERRLLDVVR